MIQAGTIFHDAKRYDDAIAKYQQVLTENPDCTLAMYELSMTLYTKGDTTAAMETAYKGTRYKSDELPLFYLAIGNIIDDVGKPDEAVKIYRDGIKMLEGDPTMTKHLASMYYNLAVTLAKQQKFPDAKVELKKAVDYDFKYSSPHYLLALIYQTADTDPFISSRGTGHFTGAGGARSKGDRRSSATFLNLPRRIRRRAISISFSI